MGTGETGIASELVKSLNGLDYKIYYGVGIFNGRLPNDPDQRSAHRS